MKMKKNFAEKAYQKTNVKASDSQDQITKKLNELGITDIRFTQVGLDHTLEFMVKLQKEEYARKVRINIPINKDLGETFEESEQKKNVLFRVALWHIKNRFVVVQNGLKDFEEEFLDDLVIVANGREQRIGDVLVPQYKASLKNNKVAILNISN